MCVWCKKEKEEVLKRVIEMNNAVFWTDLNNLHKSDII